MATAASAVARRQPFSHGSGQIRPRTAGRAMSRLTVAIASAGRPAAIWRSISGMSMCAGQASWHGARQSPTWSLSSSSSAVRRTWWTSSVSLSTSMPSTAAVAQEGTSRAVAAELDHAHQARGRRRAAVEEAQRGDVDPQPPRGVEHRRARAELRLRRCCRCVQSVGMAIARRYVASFHDDRLGPGRPGGRCRSACTCPGRCVCRT